METKNLTRGGGAVLECAYETKRGCFRSLRRAVAVMVVVVVGGYLRDHMYPGIMHI